MINSDVDTSKFLNSVKAYTYANDLELKLVMREQFRLLAQRCLDYLPPKTKSQGQKAIQSEINKKFLSLEYYTENFKLDDEKAQERARLYLRNKDFKKFDEMKKDMKFLSNVELKNTFEKSDIKRNTKGRIISGTKILLRKPSGLKKYVALKKKQVGRLKGSFGTVIRNLGGKVPAWIKSTSEYSFINKLNDTNNIGASLTSTVPYSTGVNSAVNAVNRAISSRQRDILNSIGKGLNKAQKQFYGK